METLVNNVRHSLRKLRASPGFTVTCLIILALGIGGTTAMFTLIQAVLLQSLPVRHPEQLYRVGDNPFGGMTGGVEGNFGTYSVDLYQYFRDHTEGFKELAAFQGNPKRIGVRRGGEPVESYLSELVSGNYFSMLGIDPALGRTFTASDDAAGAAPVAMISYRVWQQKFSSDASAIGSSININGRPVIIAGVTPPGFFGATLRPNPPDFWLPLSYDRVLNGAGSFLDQPTMHWLFAMGRVREDARPADLDARLKVELHQWLQYRASSLRASDREKIPQQTVRLVPAAGGIVSAQAIRNVYANGLRLLMIVSGFVMLIVCANLANLVLVRGIQGRQQTAIRVALGAKRNGLIMQALTENVILALLGGVLGVALAEVAIPLVLNLAFAGAAYVPISAHPAREVLLFAFLISLLTAVVFGAAPAWIGSGIDPIEALRGVGRSTMSRRLPQRALVVVQAALSLVLLVACGLLIASLRNLQTQSFGFQANRRFAIKIDSTLSGYKADQLDALERSIRDRLLKLPGALDVTFATYAPLSGPMWSTDIWIPGRVLSFANSSDWVAWDRVGANYFETIGTRILRGRGILEQDTASTRRVAVVNDMFVRRFFKDEDPIGKHFGKAGLRSANDYEIVGVVEDAKYFHPDEAPRPMFILPLTQQIHYESAEDNSFETRSLYPGDVILRMAGGEANVETEVRQAFAEIDPNLVVIRFLSFRSQLDLMLSQQVLIVRLTSVFGLIALALASIGLYGVTSYTVERQTREIGIRMALGASRGTILGLVIRGAFLLVGFGLVLGVPLTLATGRFLESKLYGIREYDLRVFGGAIAILAGFALMASVLPARRAASIPPTRALRME